MSRRDLSRWLPMGLCLLVALWGLCWHWIRWGGDGWFYLATGRWIWENQALPETNVFAFSTPEQAWSEQKWLACLSLYALERAVGQQGALVVLSLVAACALGLAWACAKRRSASPMVSAALVILGLLVVRWRLTARGETFGMLLLAGLLYLVERHRHQGGLKVLWIAPLTALWVNVHGSFYLGALVPGAVLASEIIKRAARAEVGPLDARALRSLAMATLLSLLAMGAHPMGYEVVLHVAWQLGALHRVVDIWGPMDIHAAPDLWAGAYMGVVWIGLLLSRKGVDWTDLLLLMPLGFEAMVSRRFMDPFVIVSLPAAAGHWGCLLKPLRGLSEWGIVRWGVRTGMAALGVAMMSAAFMYAGLLTAVAAVTVPLWVVLILPTSEHFPIPRQAEGALGHLLAQEGEGNLFNYYTWGGYVIWRGYPRVKVFIDGRDELYTNGVFEDYIHVMDARPGWEGILEIYEIRWVLLPNEPGVVTSLREDPRWAVEYEDAGAVLMRRKEA